MAILYPNIHSKLHGMYAQKMKKADIDELLKQNNTAQAIALIKSMNEDFRDLQYDSQRIKIKIILDNILINDILKISRLLDKKDRQAFEMFISIYEIKCIKSVLRQLYSNSVLDSQNDEIQNWVSRIFKNLRPLQHVKTYEELKEILRKTPYEGIFSQKNDLSDLPIFEMENSLDKVYFENLMKMARRYNIRLKDMTRQAS